LLGSSSMAHRIVLIALLSAVPSVYSDNRRLQADGQGDSQADYGGKVDYSPEPSADYTQAAAAAMPVHGKVEVHLACSCALHIPCFDFKTETCVPVICEGDTGFIRPAASFIDNRIPRFSHHNSQYGGNTANYDRKLYNDFGDGTMAADSGEFSNPLIDGCKCPSGSTRCYDCAVVGSGARVFMWILIFIYAILHFCVVRLTLTNGMPPTKANQDAVSNIMLIGFIVGLAALSALCTASGVGFFVRPWDLRRIYYTRWIDWLLSSIVMVWIVCWMGVRQKYRVVFIVALDALMILLGFVASVVQGWVKWIFFLSALFMYLWLGFTFLSGGKTKTADVNGLAPAQALISKILKFVLIGVWILYPIVWVLSSGLNLLCASTEAILYGILDLLLKGVFCSVVVYSQPFFTEGSTALEK